MTTIPNIYEFNEPLLFLRAKLSCLKEKNPNYTIRKWAQDIGVKDPISLVDIMSGHRKLKARHLSFFGPGLSLDKGESLYFLALILRVNAEGPLEKTLYDLILNQLKIYGERGQSDSREPETVLKTTEHEYMGHWVDTVILELSKLENFIVTSDSIKAALKNPIDEGMIQTRLEKLRKIRLLSQKGGRLEKSVATVTTPNDFVSANVNDYVRQVHAFASEAVDLPPKDREFQCVSVGISYDELPRFKEILRDCRDQIERLSTPKGDCVYQANLSFFPLTGIVANSGDKG